MLRGFIPYREEDRLGLGVTHIALGWDARKMRELGADTSETTYELSYRIEMSPGIALQPDYQYIINPGMNPSLDNAQTLALRLEVSL